MDNTGINTDINNMSLEILQNSLERKYPDKNHTTYRNRKSQLNRWHEYGLLAFFVRPEKMLEGLKNRYPKANTVNTHISALSCVCKELTESEKAQLFDLYCDSFNNEFYNIVKERTQLMEKPKSFDAFVTRIYQAMIKDKMVKAEKKTEKPKMTPKQKANYQELDLLKAKILGAYLIWKRKDFSKARNRYTMQFIIAAMIFTMAERMRRLDISDTKIANITDTDEAILVDNGILLRTTNKTANEGILLEFKDEFLKEAVALLVDIRKQRGEERLFLKENGDAMDSNRFGQGFSSKMEELGIGTLTMNDVRKSYTNFWWKTYDGTLAHKMGLEDRNGHSYDTWQKLYDLEEEGESNVDSDTEIDE